MENETLSNYLAPNKLLCHLQSILVEVLAKMSGNKINFFRFIFCKNNKIIIF